MRSRKTPTPPSLFDKVVYLLDANQLRILMTEPQRATRKLKHALGDCLGLRHRVGHRDPAARRGQHLDVVRSVSERQDVFRSALEQVAKVP